MSLSVIFSFLLLGVAAFVIQKKRRFEQIDILHLLFVSAIAMLLKSDFENEKLANSWSYALIALLAVNFLISRWLKLKNPMLRVLPPIISFAVLLAIFWNDSFIYLGKNFNISDKATFVLPFLGIVMYELARIKLQLLKKFFGMKDSVLNALMPLLVGITALIGAFNAEGYGVFLVGAGFLAASFYNTIGSKHILHTILAVSLVWMFAAENNIELIDVRFAKVISGLFIGAFISGFVLQMWSVEKRKNLALLLTYVLCFALFIGLLVAGVQINASFGGVEAYIGGLIGFALANSVLYAKQDEQELHQAPITMSVLIVIILVGLIVPPMLVNEEELAVQETLNSITPKNDKGEEIEIPFVSFEGLAGKHEIVKDNSLVSFKLGSAGSVTKGAIKEFSGSFNFTEDLANSSFDIKLPVLNLTTFMGMRDKSIMGDDYLKEKKFPSMRFKGSQMVPTDKKFEYEMAGSFEMLGVKKELKVLIHRVEEDSKIVLVGSGEVDRREFGMADDPREGNVVSFEFKVELK
ncbi:MAG: YceI family protein [Crocinitomicaceae bacterium]|nr:YceI family protein [Flavobacteriales bacterium]NQZ37493.1 YceI family protein [Crocinitomicaceae bacterium]